METIETIIRWHKVNREMVKEINEEDELEEGELK